MSVLTKLFTPSGKKFYDLFEQVSGNLSQLSTTFSEYISIPERTKRKPLLDKIERLEQKNDEATHRLFVELSRNYITPFDREDIHYMASSLDDIADHIWGTSKQMYYFDIDINVIATKEVADNIILFVKKLSEAVAGLRNRRELSAMTSILEDMRKINSQLDNNITLARTAMFEDKAATVEMIKLSDHYGMLQNLVNKCGEVVNVLEAMIIKYS